MTQDIRWHQRFSNHRKALQKLNIAVESLLKNMSIGNEEECTDFEELLKDGLIHRFEYTHELAWNVMKDYAAYQGQNDISGSRDATRAAFSIGLITNADDWMDMLKSRNLTTHTYNSEIADDIYNKITKAYHPLFIAFEQKMESLRFGEQQGVFDKEL